MSVLVNDLRVQLQKKIFSASSIKEIERGIGLAISDLGGQAQGNSLIDQFIDLMINDLQSDDKDKTRQQLSNIRSARIHLNEPKFYRRFEAL